MDLSDEERQADNAHELAQHSDIEAQSIVRRYKKLRAAGGGARGASVCANVPGNRELERELERWSDFLVVYTDEDRAEILPYIFSIHKAMARRRGYPEPRTEAEDAFLSAYHQTEQWEEQESYDIALTHALQESTWKFQDKLHALIDDYKKE